MPIICYGHDEDFGYPPEKRGIHVLKNDKEGGAEDLELLYLWFKNALQMIIGRDLASL